MIKIYFLKLLPYLKNKYVLTTITIFVWMLFFDRNDFISQYSYSKKLNQLEQDKKYYIEEIQKVKTDKEELFNNHKTIEKFAREKYLMKKDDEDIFMIIKKE